MNASIGGRRVFAPAGFVSAAAAQQRGPVLPRKINGGAP